MLSRRRERADPLVGVVALALMVAVAATVVACAGEGESHAPLPREFRPTESVRPEIAGGSSRQRELLATIVERFRPRTIAAVVLRRASTRGSAIAFEPIGAATLRFEWERSVLLGIARDHSARSSILRLVEDTTHGAPETIAPGAPPPPPLSGRAEKTLRKELRDAMTATGAGVVELAVTRADGAAVTAVLETSAPAPYLQRNVSRVLRVLYPYLGRLEGAYIAVLDSAGTPVWEYAVSRRLGGTRSRTVPELRGCNPIPDVPPAPEVRPVCPVE